MTFDIRNRRAAKGIPRHGDEAEPEEREQPCYL